MYAAAKIVRGDTKGAARLVDMKERYQRTKLSTKLELGGYPAQFAKVVTSMIASELAQPLMSVKKRDELNLTGLMLFDAEDEFGSQIVDVVTGFREKCHHQVEREVTSTRKFLVEAPAKSSAAHPVKTLDPSVGLPPDMPDIGQAIGRHS